MGETVADLFVEDVFGGVMGDALALFTCVLAVMLAVQFWLQRYLPGVYWACVILISIVGTLITDMLGDEAGVPHSTTIPLFSCLLFAGFVVWYFVERTLSIHTIYTFRREAFYWNVVLWTFALGTAVGDAIAEDDALGYWRTLLISVGILGFAWIFDFVSNKFAPPRTWYSILAFWIAYVTTRPLGASVGDLLTADRYATFSGDCYPASLSSTSDIYCDDEGELCTTGVDCPPDGGDNPCANGELTCVVPLECDDCFGFEAIVAVNIVFAIVVVILVTYLTIKKPDLEVHKVGEEDGGTQLAVKPSQSTEP